MIYIQMKVHDFLRELASGSPAPGGGSASALAGSMGAALVAMVARFTAGRSGDPELERQVEQKLQESIRLQLLLQEDVDRDTAAYSRVLEAYRLPKQDEAQKKERSRAIQETLQEAARQPLQVARSSLEVLQLCPWAIERGNPNTWSDAAVAALLAQSGIEGSLANVSINLAGIKDIAFKKEMKVEALEIRTTARNLQEIINGLLADRQA